MVKVCEVVEVVEIEKWKSGEKVESWIGIE